MGWSIHQDGLIEWLESYDELPLFHGILSDPPYALISIAKRFGPGNAPAQQGSDGRYSRLSKGFMGQEWDGFESLDHYQDWVAKWAKLLIDKALYPGAVCLFFGGTRTFHHLGVGLERGGFEIVDSILTPWMHGQGFPKSHEIEQGYYTALKPAWEPVFICRAPRGDVTYKYLMRMYGTGGLNVDGSRIEAEPYTINTFDEGAKMFGDAVGEAYTGREETKGRWPANVILNEALAEDLGEPAKYFYTAKASKAEKDKGLEDYYWARTGRGYIRIHVEEYLKLPEDDRAHGCVHPTVKPLALLRYLANLILPPTPATGKTTLAHPRRLLVPFSGSGSEMIAGLQAGWDIVEGVEMEEIYAMMATDRIRANIGML